MEADATESAVSYIDTANITLFLRPLQIILVNIK